MDPQLENLKNDQEEVLRQEQVLREQWVGDIFRYGRRVGELMDDVWDCEESVRSLEEYKATGDTQLLPHLELRVARCETIEPRRQSLLEQGKALQGVVDSYELGDVYHEYLDPRVESLERLKLFEPKKSTGFMSRIRQMVKGKKGGKQTRKTKTRGKRTRKH